MPGGGQGSGLGLSVADHAGHNQVWIVKSRAKGVGQAVTQLTSFVNRAWNFGGDVAGDTARKGKLLKQTSHARNVLTDSRIHTAVSSFEIGVGNDGWPSVSGADHVDHVESLTFDHAIQMEIDKVESGRGPPVTQQSRLDVLSFEGLFQEGIVHQIDLADREVVCRSPVSIQQT